MISNYEDCVFLLKSKLIFSRQFLVGALWIRKLTFVGTLFFFFCYYSFQDQNEFFTFFFSCSSRLIILVHPSAVYAKLRQTLANNKKSLVWKLSILWDEKILMKNCVTPVTHNFPCQKISDTPKGPPHKSFLGDKKIFVIFLWHHLFG